MTVGNVLQGTVLQSTTPGQTPVCRLDVSNTEHHSPVFIVKAQLSESANKENKVVFYKQDNCISRLVKFINSIFGTTFTKGVLIAVKADDRGTCTIPESPISKAEPFQAGPDVVYVSATSLINNTERSETDKLDAGVLLNAKSPQEVASIVNCYLGRFEVRKSDPRPSVNIRDVPAPALTSPAAAKSPVSTSTASAVSSVATKALAKGPAASCEALDLSGATAEERLLKFVDVDMQTKEKIALLSKVFGTVKDEKDLVDFSLMLLAAIKFKKAYLPSEIAALRDEQEDILAGAAVFLGKATKEDVQEAYINKDKKVKINASLETALEIAKTLRNEEEKQIVLDMVELLTVVAAKLGL